jgi:hypothetical protein
MGRVSQSNICAPKSLNIPLKYKSCGEVHFVFDSGWITEQAEGRMKAQ